MMEEYQPVLDPGFAGRREELERLDHLVTFGAARNWPIFVVGAAGVGKTALVKQWLASMKWHQSRPWRVGRLVPLWLDVSSRLDAQTVVGDFIKRLYDDPASEGGRRQESVVVIDGADALSESDVRGFVAKLFNLKRILSVVFTSRHAPSMGRAEIVHLGSLGETEALFRQLLGDNLSATDLADALAATHGFPLAIALLARFAKVTAKRRFLSCSLGPCIKTRR